MADDFDPPFADSADIRMPTDNEADNGFPCGPADQRLFNGLINRLEGNIGHVAAQAGEAPAQANDHTLLWRSIVALIAAATGETSGGDTSNFVLFTQARARLPFYPEVLNTDGRIVITSPGVGQIRIPGGVDFLHRGIGLVTTSHTDINTDARQTYHLRWNPTDGYALKDLSSGVYNPGPEAETHTKFDSTFDDMLIARIVTNVGNVPTITNLANKNKLSGTWTKATKEQQGGGTWTGLPHLTANIDWARSPKQRSIAACDVQIGVNFEAIVTQGITTSRYALDAAVLGYVVLSSYATPYTSGSVTVDLGA